MEKKIRLLLLIGVMSFSFSVMADATADCIKDCNDKYAAGSVARTKCVQGCYTE